MKWNKPEHNHDQDTSNTLFKHTPDTVKQYQSNLFNSSKCKKMSHGSCNILRIISWARGDNWRRNHKSEKKHHKH